MPAATPGPPQCPAVLLLHTLPSGRSHFDWLTARDPSGAAPLLAFRVGVRLDRTPLPAFDAERLPDHRPRYLDYEGPLEPKAGVDRGAVRRLARGSAVVERADDRAAVLLTDWGAGPIRCEGAPATVTRPGGLWRFTVTRSG